MNLYTDSQTGKQITGKAYLLQSTEGTEVIDPARLLTDNQADDVEVLQERVRALEEALAEHLKEWDAAKEPETAPAKKAPAKKAGGA